MNERGKLGGPVRDGERLWRGRQTQRGERRDLLVAEPQRVVERGVAQGPEIVDAGNGEARGDQPMPEMQRRQLRAGGPAGKHHAAGEPVRRPVIGEPVERGADLLHDCRELRLRRERIAGHRDRPAGLGQSFGKSGEELAGIALPIAAVDEDEAGRLRRGRRIKIEAQAGARRVGDVEAARMGLAIPRGGGVAGLDQRGAVRDRRIVVVGRVALGLVERGPLSLRRGRVGGEAHAA